tara:strand:+ start:20 stop:232 length:213 start_codon:yes stop_codon:yes gene_type:complete
MNDINDPLTPKEKQDAIKAVSQICTILICGSCVILAAQVMEVKHILMFSYGMGLLTRPLSERVTKLIERK